VNVKGTEDDHDHHSRYVIEIDWRTILFVTLGVCVCIGLYARTGDEGGYVGAGADKRRLCYSHDDRERAADAGADKR